MAESIARLGGEVFHFDVSPAQSAEPGMVKVRLPGVVMFRVDWQQLLEFASEVRNAAMDAMVSAHVSDALAELREETDR